MIKITKRITEQNKKKLETISAKAQRKYKISPYGRKGNLVSEDAVLRYAIDKVDEEEFINNIKI